MRELAGLLDRNNPEAEYALEKVRGLLGGEMVMEAKTPGRQVGYVRFQGVRAACLVQWRRA